MAAEMTPEASGGGRGGGARLAALSLLLVALDQLTKFAARHFLAPGMSREVIPGFFNLTLVFNQGAAWGMLAGFRIGFVLLAIAMIAFIALRRRQIFGDGALGQAAAALLAGGIVGNAIDRAYCGRVTDFIDLWHGTYHFPCFNVADSAICVGVAIYFLASFRAQPQKGR